MNKDKAEIAHGPIIMRSGQLHVHKKETRIGSAVRTGYWLGIDTSNGDIDFELIRADEFNSPFDLRGRTQQWLTLQMETLPRLHRQAQDEHYDRQREVLTRLYEARKQLYEAVKHAYESEMT